VNGDIICYQASPPIKEEEGEEDGCYNVPTLPRHVDAYFSRLLYKRTIRLRPYSARDAAWYIHADRSLLYIYIYLHISTYYRRTIRLRPYSARDAAWYTYPCMFSPAMYIVYSVILPWTQPFPYAASSSLPPLQSSPPPLFLC
jgi:hypothetical protein